MGNLNGYNIIDIIVGILVTLHMILELNRAIRKQEKSRYLILIPYALILFSRTILNTNLGLSCLVELVGSMGLMLYVIFINKIIEKKANVEKYKK